MKGLVMTEENTTPPDNEPTVLVKADGEVVTTPPEDTIPPDSNEPDWDNEDAPKPEHEPQRYVHVEQLDPARNLPHTAPYLDEELRIKAEIQRAKIEDREPDLDNPPAVGSTTLVHEDRVFKHPLNSLTPKDEATVTL